MKRDLAVNVLGLFRAQRDPLIGAIASIKLLAVGPKRVLYYD
jgi:uncharacterized protein YPO0396